MSPLVVSLCSIVASGWFAVSISAAVLIVWLFPIRFLPRKANKFFKATSVTADGV